VKEVNSQVKIFHYLFLREMLASRRLWEELDVMMKGHLVSCYERWVIKKKIFTQTLAPTTCIYFVVLRSGRGKVLQGAVTLRNVIETLLSEKSSHIWKVLEL
jgi:hypothetical protein